MSYHKLYWLPFGSFIGQKVGGGSVQKPSENACNVSMFEQPIYNKRWEIFHLYVKRRRHYSTLIDEIEVNRQ